MKQRVEYEQRRMAEKHSTKTKILKPQTNNNRDKKEKITSHISETLGVIWAYFENYIKN